MGNVRQPLTRAICINCAVCLFNPGGPGRPKGGRNRLQNELANAILAPTADVVSGGKTINAWIVPVLSTVPLICSVAPPVVQPYRIFRGG